MPPKKPFKLPKFPKKQTPSPTLPTTPISQLDLAIDYEEQGDRWIISDLSKTLRAYQKAYETYELAVSNDDRDAWYNYLRLIYHVHETYKSVLSVDLDGIEGCTVHLIGLEGVKKEYERVVKGKFAGWLNWECAFNEVLISLELLENGDLNWDAGCKVVEEGVNLIKQLLEFQVGELDLFIKRIEGVVVGDEEVKQDEDKAQEDEEFQMFEQITPSSVLESVTTGYKLVQAAFEFCETREQTNVMFHGLRPLMEDTLRPIADLILSKFDPQTNPEDTNQLNVQKPEILELRLTEWCVQGLLITDFTQLSTHWQSYPYENTSERYLAEADSMESFLSFEEHSSEGTWTIITGINRSLKTAQELLAIELNDHKARKTAEVSSKVSKIVQILINRADNELIRSQLQDYEPSVKNADVLRQNSVNLLKSGLNMSQSNVGLRETIGSRLTREKLRRECIARLVVLTKENVSEQDFARNLGAKYWEKEVADLRRVDIYKAITEVTGVSDRQ